MIRLRPSPILALLLVTGAALAAVWVVDRSEQARFRQMSRSDVLRRVGSTRAQLETGLNRRLFLARGLVTHVATHGGIDRAEFEVLARLLLDQRTGLRSIQLARNSIVSHVYPLEGNQAAIGHDLLRDPDRSVAVRRAIATRLSVAAGPFKSAQGREVVGQIPIFLPAAAAGSGEMQYWGLALIVIDLNTLLSESGLLDRSDELSVALRRVEENIPAGEVFFGDSSVFRSEPVVSDVSFPGGAWQLAAVPAGGWLPRAPGSWKWRGGGSLLAAAFGLLVWLLARQPEQLRRAVDNATAALSQSEQRYRTLARLAPVGMFRTDAAGQDVYVNERWCEMSGLQASEAMGGGWIRAIHPEDVTRVAAEWQRAILEKSYSRTEFRFLHRDGRVLWALGQSAPEYDSCGNVVGYVGTTTDITDRKLAEEEARLHQAELAHVARLSTMGEMASGLAHELNQPLAAIVNYARGSAIRIQQRGSEHQHDLVDAMNQIATLATRAGEIIRSLRHFVRKREPKTEIVDVNGIVREVASFTQGEAQSHSVTLQVELEGQLPSMEADSIQIEQVILNLVRNAIESMPDSDVGRRQVTIRTAASDSEHILVSVEDTGKGLQEEFAEQIFDPFFTTKPGGMGMGLSISRSIIESHGGRLWAGPAPGGGTLFQFTLPTLPETHETRIVEEAEPNVSAISPLVGAADEQRRERPRAGPGAD